MINIIRTNKKYIFYGLSIILSRGLEYLVVFYAAFYLSKELYGELEYYKRIIEFLSVIVAFGLPGLLLTYTKSSASKLYFSFLSLIFILIIGIILFPILYIFNYGFLLIPLLFHAIFFNNGIMPVFFLIEKGSNIAAIYKSVVSLFFYVGTFILLYFGIEPQYSFIDVNYYMFPLILICILYMFFCYKINYKKLLRYFSLFKKTLFNSLSLVVSNFANIAFLYTDILIIKILSDKSNVDIANYSFVLNITSVLVLIPLTMVQVDIEKLKKDKDYAPILNKRIMVFVAMLSLALLVLFTILTSTFFKSYSSVFLIFTIILVAKNFQSFSVIQGAQVIIRKKFSQNLKINIISLVSNIVLSYLLYFTMNLTGIALSSTLSLALRYYLLYRLNKSLVHEV